MVQTLARYILYHLVISEVVEKLKTLLFLEICQTGPVISVTTRWRACMTISSDKIYTCYEHDPNAIKRNLRPFPYCH